LIREAGIDDIEEMGILWRLMMKEIQPEKDVLSKYWEGYQSEMIVTSMYHGLVVFVDDVMVGFVTALIYEDLLTGKKSLFGQDFYLIPELRNSRIARSLYRKMLELGKSQKVEIYEGMCYEGQLEMWKRKGCKVYKYHVRR
jgi:hypothetical protein